MTQNFQADTTLGKRTKRIDSDLEAHYYEINKDVPITQEQELEYDWLLYEHDVFEDFIIFPQAKRHA